MIKSFAQILREAGAKVEYPRKNPEKYKDFFDDELRRFDIENAETVHKEKEKTGDIIEDHTVPKPNSDFFLKNNDYEEFIDIAQKEKAKGNKSNVEEVFISPKRTAVKLGDEDKSLIFQKTSGKYGEGGNKGNQYEVTLQSEIQAVIAKPSTITEYPDVLLLRDALGIQSFKGFKIVSLGGQNQKRTLDFDAFARGECVIQNASREIADTLVDLKLQSKDAEYNLSIKYGPGVALINSGLGARGGSPSESIFNFFNYLFGKENTSLLMTRLFTLFPALPQIPIGKPKISKMDFSKANSEHLQNFILQTLFDGSSKKPYYIIHKKTSKSNNFHVLKMDKKMALKISKATIFDSSFDLNNSKSASGVMIKLINPYMPSLLIGVRDAMGKGSLNKLSVQCGGIRDA